MRLLKKLVTYMLIMALVVTNFYLEKSERILAASSLSSQSFLKANGKVLKNNYGNGDTVYLRGTNAGGYMLQEFWMCPTNYSTNVSDQMDILNTLTSRFGADGARTLVNTYEANYWKESDFDECANLGMNCIRLPLWYRNFVDANGNWYSDAFSRVDWFVEQAGKRGMYVIIDMHGAYGSQNGSDHSGVDGGDNKMGASEFFFGSNAGSNQEKYYAMWEKLAEHFKGNPTVAGYDLLNEPYCTYRYNSGYSDEQLHSWLWNVYDNAYKKIRAIDSDHVIIMEATWDSWDLPNPSSYGWENVMYEYHNYEYSDYDNAENKQITSMQNKINNILSANYNVPSYMGEFSYFNNLSAWETGLQLLNDSGINWTSWSYKCVAEYGNWGIMNQSVDKVNVESDSYDTILAKWSNVGSSYENTGLASTIKKYTTVAGPSDPGSTNLADGKYYIECANSDGEKKIVCAEDEGNAPLIANRDTYGGAWETLYVVNNGDGTISLKSDINGKYVCAVVDENCQLLARTENTPSTWEKFYPVHITGNQYALRAVANDKYVKADFDDTANQGQLKAVSDSVGGAWECFFFNRLDASEPTTQPSTTQAPTTQAPTTKTPVTNPETTTKKEETTQPSGENPIEVVGFAIQKIEGNNVTFVWGQTQEQMNCGQKYNVYIDGALYQTYQTAQEVTYTFSSSGSHTITIKAELGGRESSGVTLSADIAGGSTNPGTEIVLSDKINIEGIQISQVNWGLRIVSSVEPEINGQKVVEYGNIYAIKLGNVTEQDMIVNSTNSRVARYTATDAGIINTKFSDSDTAVNYVRTMNNNGTTGAAYNQEYMVRGYAKLADGSFVYSKVASYSIFKVAEVLYSNSWMPTYNAHEYIYKNILKVVNNNYGEVSYNWSQGIVKP